MASPLEGLEEYSSDELEYEVQNNAKRRKFHRLQRLSESECNHIIGDVSRSNRKVRLSLIGILKLFRKWEIISLMRKELDQSVEENKAKWSMSKLGLARRWTAQGNPVQHAIYQKRRKRYDWNEFYHVKSRRSIQGPTQSIQQQLTDAIEFNKSIRETQLRLKGMRESVADEIMAQANSGAISQAQATEKLKWLVD